MSLGLLHILPAAATARRTSGVAQRAVRQHLPLRNTMVTVPEHLPNLRRFRSPSLPH
jgi:hypothetical protein